MDMSLVFRWCLLYSEQLFRALTYGCHGFQCQRLDCGHGAWCWSTSISAQHLWLRRDARSASLYPPFRAKSFSIYLVFWFSPAVPFLRIMFFSPVFRFLCLSLLPLSSSPSNININTLTRKQLLLAPYGSFHSQCKLCATARDSISVTNRKKFFRLGKNIDLTLLLPCCPFSFSSVMIQLLQHVTTRLLSWSYNQWERWPKWWENRLNK